MKKKKRPELKVIKPEPLPELRFLEEGFIRDMVLSSTIDDEDRPDPPTMKSDDQ